MANGRCVKLGQDASTLCGTGPGCINVVWNWARMYQRRVELGQDVSTPCGTGPGCINVVWNWARMYQRRVELGQDVSTPCGTGPGCINVGTLMFTLQRVLSIRMLRKQQLPVCIGSMAATPGLRQRLAPQASQQRGH